MLSCPCRARRSAMRASTFRFNSLMAASSSALLIVECEESRTGRGLLRRSITMADPYFERAFSHGRVNICCTNLNLNPPF